MLLNETIIEQLLQPISTENDIGDDVEHEVIFEKINQARKEDETVFNEGDWAYAQIEKADWSIVIQLCLEGLTSYSKNVQLVCWLIEAQGKLYGMDGIQQGLGLLARLYGRFGSRMYPLLEDEEDIQSIQAAHLCWLDKKLMQQLLSLPFSQDGSVNLSLLRQLDDKESITTVSQYLITLPECKNKLKESDREYMNQQWQTLIQLEEAIDSFYSVIHEYPVFINIDFTLLRKALHEIKSYIEPLIQNDPNVYPEEEDNTPGKGESSLSYAQKRYYMIEQLQNVAIFFKEHEPSSPLPFLLERTIRWANMNLMELLEEMLEDNRSIFNDIQRNIYGRKNEE